MIQGRLLEEDEPDPAPAAALPERPPNYEPYQPDPFAGMRNHPLPLMLEVAVPLWIMQLQEKGGPTDEDFDRLREEENTLAASSQFALFKSEKPGESARAFNAIARSIAVLSYLPGGCSLFGRHWETRREEQEP